MDEFTIYYTATGEIISSGSSFTDLHPLNTGESRLLIASDVLSQFVLNGAIVNRKEMPVTVEGGLVSGIPVGTKVFIDELVVVDSSTEATLTLHKPNPLDTYQLRLVNFPYIDYEATV